MAYILPDKSLLEEKNDEVIDNGGYLLSKLLYKKDLKNKLLFPIGLNKEDKFFIDFEFKSSLLIQGETGSGKSTLINSIIVSMLLKNTPEDLKFLFIDPRKVELGVYEELPHMLKHVIKSREEALYELDNIKDELVNRQNLFITTESKNINNYFEKTGIKLPHIIVIIDEAMDIITDKNFEKNMLELITEGYRYGLHIIIATSSDLRDKLSPFFIRAFDYLLTYDLASQDQADYIKINKADLLTIYGEALIRCSGNKIIDLETPYISEKEIDKIVNFITKQNKE